MSLGAYATHRIIRNGRSSFSQALVFAPYLVWEGADPECRVARTKPVWGRRGEFHLAYPVRPHRRTSYFNYGKLVPASLASTG